MVWLLPVFVLAAAAVSTQTSQPPPPTALASGQQQQEQRQQQADTPSSENQTGNQAAGIAPAPREPERNAIGEERDGENTDPALEWGTVADWAIVVFTAVLTVFTALQIAQNRRSRILTQELERARFSVENRKFEQIGTGQVHITYELANKGRSVAKLLRSANQTLFLSEVPQPPIELEWNNAPDLVQPGDQLVRQNQIHSLPAEQSRQLVAKTLFITIVGGIEYEDIFGKTHVRRYAFMYAWRDAFMPPRGDAVGYNEET